MHERTLEKDQSDPHSSSAEVRAQNLNPQKAKHSSGQSGKYRNTVQQNFK